MALREQIITLAEFQAFVARSENSDRMFELIDGEIIEVSPGRTRNSQINHLLAFPIMLFCQQNNLPCYTSGGDGTYSINGHVVAPDFAYKTTSMSDEYPDPVPPLSAAEIISPTDKPADIQRKRRIYIQAGILYWELYSETETIDVHAPGQPVRSLGIDDLLDGDTVLPGLKIPVKSIFPQQDQK
jgi:Uma2 family endonuclease